jgi:alpha-D-ribose 1-methylphosphonate 5-triphosphate synthase subunit PhnL
LGDPVLYQSGSYEDPIDLDCSWSGQLVMTQPGHFNALRIITKSVLTVLEHEQRTIDWVSQYLVVPMDQVLEVSKNDVVRVGFSYQAGDPIAAFEPRLLRP